MVLSSAVNCIFGTGKRVVHAAGLYRGREREDLRAALVLVVHTGAHWDHVPGVQYQRRHLLGSAPNRGQVGWFLWGARVLGASIRRFMEARRRV